MKRCGKLGSLHLVGVIGDPVAHSLSPRMHNAAFAAQGLKRWIYLPFRVRPAALGRFFRWAAAQRLDGFNLTVPHKEKGLRHVARLSPAARAIGAINTVVRARGGWRGDNTDWQGYLDSLRRAARFGVRGKRVCVLGAGGAARGILFALRQAGARQVWIANRTPAKARRLAREFGAAAVPLTREALAALFPQIDLLVQTTSAGIAGRGAGAFWHRLPLARLPRRTVVSDLNYRPALTPLLARARRLGLKTHSGLGMLVHQGALSYRLWTGRRPPLEVMHRAVKSC